MRQARSVPNLDGAHRRLVQNLANNLVRGIGTGQRCNEIVLRANAERVSHASQYSVDLPVSAVSVEIKNGKSGGCIEQLLIGHGFLRAGAKFHATIDGLCRLGDRKNKIMMERNHGSAPMRSLAT